MNDDVLIEQEEILVDFVDMREIEDHKIIFMFVGGMATADDFFAFDTAGQN